MSLQQKNTSLHLSGTVARDDTWQENSGKYHLPEMEGYGLHVKTDAHSKELQTSAGDQTVERLSFTPLAGVQKPIDPKKHTILLVEDDEDCREIYSSLFDAADYNVIEANDGLVGLDMASKVHPDLIFTGIIMPRMDGFSMIEALGKNPELAHIPVIVSSPLDRDEDKKRAQELGVRDFIVQGSIASCEIVDCVHAILTRREYTIPLDLSRTEYAGLAKELVGIDGHDLSRGTSPVLKISVTNPTEYTVHGYIVFE